MCKVRIALALVALASTVGCSQDSGQSSVAALYLKATAPGRIGEWDRVATIHGMADNMGFCTQIIEALKAAGRDTSGSEYSCGPVAR